ncbi:DUF2949 domain-containing protein [Pantanalinema sp. GBBB05]|uniref:DUF2949 domain-containing protein n=1 Tax=Pantanalinema sp. GBBB05 TaxID=2604139 RepID=UPI001E127518|nr:DUF2949 domain-containing protein [Pantanalinema sp. GBBB05]
MAIASEPIYSQLKDFLKEELAIPADSIPLVLQHCAKTPHRLPVVLWQHRLITLSQLDRIFTWLSDRYPARQSQA